MSLPASDIRSPARLRQVTPTARRQGIPAEGENGVFTQSWFAMALSRELAPGQVIGRDFLDGRIVLFRGQNGRAVAMSAYCPHVGADLSVGEVIGDNLRCAFHHWEYGEEGRCVKTGVGDKPPKGACLFKFPTQERFGIIWVFNGETPLFDLPSFPYPDDELAMSHPYEPELLPVDPWVFCANTPDRQHTIAVHKMRYKERNLDANFVWDPFGFTFRFAGDEPSGGASETTVAIRGTSVFYRSRQGNFWRGSIVGFGLPRPGQLTMHSTNFVLKGPKAAEQLALTDAASRKTLDEDRDIIKSLHYRPRELTETDKSLARFLAYVRKYPRAHPSADFIR